MTHLLLLCCAGTVAARTGAFADPDEPLDAGGRRAVARLSPPRPTPDRLFAAPAAAARETAEVAGLAPVREPRLADIDHGDWAGRSFAAVHAAAPEAFAAWLAAPEHGTPGGETFEALMRRVDGWLGEQAATGGSVLGITHPMVVRAALCVTLGMTPAVAMRIDLSPLAHIRLSFNRGWRLRSLSPTA